MSAPQIAMSDWIMAHPVFATIMAVKAGLIIWLVCFVVKSVVAATRRRPHDEP